MPHAAEFLFRQATGTDLPALCECDVYARDHQTRRVELRQAIEDGSCFLLEVSDELLGFGVLGYHFFGNGFISLISIAPRRQRQGLGLKLLHQLESACLTPKIFISTNASNKAAQHLFLKAGFVPSGSIDNLDEGDPECIYFKMLRPVVQSASPTLPHQQVK